MNTVAVAVPFRGESEVSVWLLRSLIESLRLYAPDLPIVIADDRTAHPESLAYLAFLETSGWAGVRRLGTPIDESYYRTRVTTPDTSHGHSVTMDGAVRGCAELGARIAWVLDPDSVLLSDARWRAAVLLFDRHPAVIAVADYFGGERPFADYFDEPTDVVCGLDEEIAYDTQTGAELWRRQKADRPYHAAAWCVGWPPPSCQLVDLSRFWGRRVLRLRNAGWVNSRWYYSQMWLGRQTAYWPFYRDRHVVHLGYGVLNDSRKQTAGFGNVNTGSHRRYAQRHASNFYAGYLQIESSESYLALLRDRYAGRPYQESAGQFPAGTFIEPTGVGPARPDPALVRLRDGRIEYVVEGAVVGLAIAHVDMDSRVASLSEVCMRDRMTETQRVDMLTQVAQYVSTRGAKTIFWDRPASGQITVGFNPVGDGRYVWKAGESGQLPEEEW